MPADFICSSSRFSSGFVAAGPNHHQRTIMRQSSGGCAKESCSAVTGLPSDVVSGFCAGAVAAATMKNITSVSQRSKRRKNRGIEGQDCIIGMEWQKLLEPFKAGLRDQVAGV